eukprot:TRINITY_DN50443_c0_g1_i1.p1 TRINITY_DN50443_c0_g1~~TRINITY_DN50443_c0_g1_i1.p1  ORF type:complete len:454 (-),score=55.39 TRINITY_DN50443_c0_g1_i1:30-1391(-)
MAREAAPLVPLAEPAGGTLSWIEAGFILFAFASPSAIMAVPYTIAMSGFLAGGLIILVITAASMFGSLLLLEVKLRHPHCRTFSDMGGVVMGSPGRVWGNLIQLGNFLLFLPCALTFCGEALSGIGHGIAGLDCTTYYMFVVAGICFLSMQARTLSNTRLMSMLSFVCVIVMSTCMIYAAFKFNISNKVDAYYFGNPEPDAALSFVKFCGGCTICSWAYVPAFLTVELSTCMKHPGDMRYAIIASGVLNIVCFLVVGINVVSQWGYGVGEIIGITAGVTAWTAGTSLNNVFNTFQLIGNFNSYALDSVPLGRFCQQTWDKDFADTWKMQDILRYALSTLPAFSFGVIAATFAPSVNTLLDFTTALTVPMVTQIYPAVLYSKMLSADAANSCQPPECSERSTKTIPKLGVAAVLLIGIVNMVFCSVKAVGFLAVESLRPPMSIGCEGWAIYNGR